MSDQTTNQDQPAASEPQPSEEEIRKDDEAALSDPLTKLMFECLKDCDVPTAFCAASIAKAFYAKRTAQEPQPSETIIHGWAAGFCSRKGDANTLIDHTAQAIKEFLEYWRATPKNQQNPT